MSPSATYFLMASLGVSAALALLMLTSMPGPRAWLVLAIFVGLGGLAWALVHAQRALTQARQDARQMREHLDNARTELSVLTQQIQKERDVSARRIAIERARVAFPDVPAPIKHDDPEPGPRRISLP